MTHRSPFQPLPCWDSVILSSRVFCYYFVIIFYVTSQLFSKGGCQKAGFRASGATSTAFRPQKHPDSVTHPPPDLTITSNIPLLPAARVAACPAGPRGCLLSPEPSGSPPSPCYSPRSCGPIPQTPSQCPAGESRSGAEAQCLPL